jgi:hypothetical protein
VIFFAELFNTTNIIGLRKGTVHRRAAKAAERGDFSLVPLLSSGTRENYISLLGVLTHHGYK